ncbi:MAG: DUF3108 domain-containing protein [Arcobacteraceae bacterium]|jgi:hypothetical protein|nr:DUF3108 domain-containing protein [Arcobacteraceae bacterium]
MKYFLLLILIFTTSFSDIKILERSYAISYGIFSNLGISNTKLIVDTDNKTYVATIEAKTVGFANFLSNNRFEVYESKGEIVDGFFVPDRFRKFSATNSKSRESIYLFNHSKKSILLIKNRKSKNEKSSNSEEILEYYSNNDILSLFFNLKDILPTLNLNEEVEFIGVGNDKNKGITNILKLGDNRFKVYLNQPIFSSSRGELLIEQDFDGLCKTAILKDVLLFGDIVAK